MRSNPYDSVFHLNQATSLGELYRVFERLVASYGFDLFAIQYKTAEQKDANAQPYILGNYSKEWLDHYHANQYDKIDPVILCGKQMREPFVWSRDWQGMALSPMQKKLFDEAEAFHVSAGAGLPLPLPDNEPCIATFVSSACKIDEVKKIVAESHLELALLSVTLQQTANRILAQEAAPNAPELTAREKECLTWAAAGKTDAEIGMILNISHRTVNAHMSGAYRKLNCVSREQAIVKAIRMRLISV